MKQYNSRVGVREGEVAQIAPSPFSTEDAHASLLTGLADEPAYDILQLDPIRDPDLVGLIINGRLRATYRKVDVYTPSSMVAQSILDRAMAQAHSCNAVVRNINRAARGSMDGATARGVGPIPSSVEPEPSTWETDVFTPPPMSDGSESAHGQEVLQEEEIIAVPDRPEEPLFDMGPIKKLDDDELSDSLPSFFEAVTGLASKHEVPEVEEGRD